jgi:co-chaperonin GroES (HSP10)
MNGIYRTPQGADMQMAEYDGTNMSGLQPVCDRVVVKVDSAVSLSTGGIHFVDEHAERATLSATYGVIVALGPTAFVWDTDRVHRWEGARPAAGDRICFQKYAGMEQIGADGQMYRIMQDKVVGATVARVVHEVMDVGGITAGTFEEQAA